MQEAGADEMVAMLKEKAAKKRRSSAREDLTPLLVCQRIDA